MVKLKYCNTCMIYRPRRAVHCQNCDSCVEQFDHHCPFISTCVGRRNYTSFFFFVVTLLADCIFLFAVTAHDLDRRLSEPLLLSVTKEEAWALVMGQVPMSIPILLLTVAALVGLVALLLFHLKLNLFNQTTNEAAKKTYRGYYWSPFQSGSYCKNLNIGVLVAKTVKPVFRPREIVAYTTNSDGIVTRATMNTYMSPNFRTPPQVVV